MLTPNRVGISPLPNDLFYGLGLDVNDMVGQTWTRQPGMRVLYSGGTTDGLEATIKNTVLFAYYGGIIVERNEALDANGTSLIGYGYKGSANSQNRGIQEGTIGFNQTLWRNPRYGAINLIGQYFYLTRDPWSVAAGAPKATHDNTIDFDIRYSLPGAMPKF
jgi:hypothetical protein